MRARSALVLTLLAVAAPAAAALAQQAPQPGEKVWDRVVATVGDTALLYSDVLVELEAMQAAGQQVPTDPAGRATAVHDVIQRRVEDLILLEAARREGAKVDQAEVAGSVEEQINRVQQQFGSQAGFEQALAASGRTLEQYRKTLTQQYTDQTIIQRYIRERTSKMAAPQVSDAEISQYFEEQKGSLGTRPATVSFQQVIVKPVPSAEAKARARAKADSVLAEVRRGGDFEVLARRYSADPSATQGGMLGWFRAGQMVRPFEQAAFAMRPGDISPVVETEYGYHIIKLEKVRGAERQARHILIRPEITEADVALARARADSVAASARAGVSMTDLAAKYETPADQRNLRDVVLSRLPPIYSQAVASATAGQVVGPFELPEGPTSSYVIAKVTEQKPEGAYTLADVKDQVRDRLVQQKQIERLLAELRQVTHVTVAP